MEDLEAQPEQHGWAYYWDWSFFFLSQSYSSNKPIQTTLKYDNLIARRGYILKHSNIFKAAF